MSIRLTISDIVYDGTQLKFKDDLVIKITLVINHLNQSKRQKAIDLYKTIRGRLCLCWKTQRSSQVYLHIKQFVSSII